MAAKALLFKLFVALILVLLLCEVIEALENPKAAAAAAKAKKIRKRLVHEPYDPANVDPEDPYDESEERPPMPPGMFEGSATPKLVKGINLKGDKGAKEFQEMTDRLKMQGDNIEYDMTTAMQRAHRHNKVLEKLRRQKIVEARKKTGRKRD